VVFWKHLSGGIFELYEILPGFVFAVIAGVIVSKDSQPDEDITAEFEQFKFSL